MEICVLDLYHVSTTVFFKVLWSHMKYMNTILIQSSDLIKNHATVIIAQIVSRYCHSIFIKVSWLHC